MIGTFGRLICCSDCQDHILINAHLNLDLWDTLGSWWNTSQSEIPYESVVLRYPIVPKKQDDFNLSLVVIPTVL